MPRTPDPNSPAAWFVIRGDCLSHLPQFLLLFVLAYHRFQLPPDTREPVTPLPE
jgi:hypothetical protein